MFLMMADETFSERFARLVAGYTDTDLGAIMGTTADAARKLRLGDIKSIRLDRALRLCRRLGISPWELAGEPEPTASTDPSARRALGETNLDLSLLAGEVRERFAELETRLESLEGKQPSGRRAAG